ncbi:hypothetical protein [Pacificoceanicola onchidii]|uniref:hypothetical protein n=1 Tax=Pacificoceanicola onchidii TaxID=2562685 RepID=UPI0010A34815|nr:hypothetical protein [Pacificoceanicola onchidii]
MYSIEIQTVTCNRTGDSGRIEDDVEIIVQSDGNGPCRYPVFGAHSMGSGDAWDLTDNGTVSGQIYYFSNAITVQLYDRDGATNEIDSADPLASFGCFRAQNGGPDIVGTFTERDDKNACEADYEITYTIRAVEQLPAPDNETPSDTLISAIRSNVAAWATSSAGQEIIATTDPQDLEDLLKEAIVSTAFKDIGEALQSTVLDTKIKGISLGVMATADICFGVTGAFGIAVARDDFQFVGMGGDKEDLDSAIYAGGGLLEGADVALDGELALGIWYVEPKDFSGRVIGVDADIGDGLDVEGVAYASYSDDDEENEDLKTDGEFDVAKIRDKAKATFVGTGIGLGDGADVQEAHFFAGALPGNTPCYQSGDYDHAAIVTEIRCISSWSNNNNDNVMMHYFADGDCPPYTFDSDTGSNRYDATDDPSEITGQYRFPIWNSREMDKDSDTTWGPGPVIKFNDSFYVDLHAAKGPPNERDTHDNRAIVGIHHCTLDPSKSTFIGSPGVSKTLTYEFIYKGSDVKYEVDVQLLY